MKKVTCVAVVLHYMGIDDTRKCINSILDNCDDTDIIVVDNASQNGTGELLRDEFIINDRVTVLLNRENLGFSAGNNVGIKYALENFDFSFLILANNDTAVLDNNFTKSVLSAYKTYHFAVLGPMIKSADGRFDSNPLYIEPYSREKALHDIKFHKQRIKALNNPIYAFFNKAYKTIKSKLGKSKNFVRRKLCGADLFKPHEDVVLHGAFLVFSKDYFEKFSGLDARTFLYAEEDILYTHCKKNNLKMLYFPEIAVFHKEGAANGGLDTKDKKLFFSKHAINAISAYLELLDEYETKENI